MEDNQYPKRYTNISLPKRKYRPGEGIHPDKDLQGSHIPELPQNKRVFDKRNWIGSVRYLYAIDLFNWGFWWEAHEVLEKLWIQTGKTTEVGLFIQGIIQISAALLKASQGLTIGAKKLAQKGLPKIRQQDGTFLGIIVEEFITDIDNFFIRGGLQEQPQIKLEGVQYVEG